MASTISANTPDGPERERAATVQMSRIFHARSEVEEKPIPCLPGSESAGPFCVAEFRTSPSSTSVQRDHRLASAGGRPWLSALKFERLGEAELRTLSYR